MIRRKYSVDWRKKDGSIMSKTFYSWHSLNSKGIRKDAMKRIQKEYFYPVYVKDFDFIHIEKYKDAIQSFLENKDVNDIFEIKLIDLYNILKLQDSILSNYKLISIEQFERQRQNKSKAGKASWSKLSPEERSKIAKERGKAGALKRWNKK